MPMRRRPKASTGGTAGPALPEGHALRSPMVGTFYASSAWTSRPSLPLASRSRKARDLAIIEAMKMLTRSKPITSGTIVAILGENGQPVEFDQPLFVIG